MKVDLQRLTDVAGLVLLHDGICELLVDKDVIVPVLLLDAAIGGRVPENVME